ncbi:MAG: PepSY domain-containing protein [Anaerolineae bacterium]|nr:PepSY domain-containing protein [Anaerolineae bacterium]
MSKKFLLVLTLISLLMVSGLAFAQTDSLGLLGTLEIARVFAADDARLTSVQYDEDYTCWDFEFTDGTEVCISDATGESVDNSVDISASTDTSADDSASTDTSADDSASTDTSADDSASTDTSADDSSSTDSSSDDNSVVVDPTISLEEAIAAALEIFPGSTVSSAELSVKDDGSVVWEIQLDNDVRGVDVDSETGSILFFGYEDNDNDGSFNSVNDNSSHNEDSSSDLNDNSSDDNNDNSSHNEDSSSDNEDSSSDDNEDNSSDDEGSD